MADDTQPKQGAAAPPPAPPPPPARPPAADPPPAVDPMPASVTLANLYSFWEGDENGKPKNLRTWFEGQVETDPATIKLLIERGAPLKK